jgi:protein-S-isoprenylcysteine O-methyltransferase Ste14
MELPAKIEMSDLIGRAMLVAIFGVFATAKGIAIANSVRAPKIDILELATQVANMAFLLLVVFLVTVRLKPSRGIQSWEARISALLGSALPLLLLALPQNPSATGLRIAGLILIAVGWLMSVYVVSYLGRSFSVMPQARRLVTAGPYRVVRHPLYIAEEVAVVGVMLLYLSWAALAVAVVHWLIQLRRMANEERVLAANFPEYEIYSKNTPRVIPRLISPGVARTR